MLKKMENPQSLKLAVVKKTNHILQSLMAVHYSAPKGFVGRSICYLVYYNDVCYGAIVGGSACRFLPGRDEFFGGRKIQEIINNIFFHVEPKDGKYPIRNFSQKVIALWRDIVKKDWLDKYKTPIVGFETLVELPRTGEVYRRDGWTEVGTTKGFTCKRIAGKGTDSWSGKRIWDTENLRPKLVFCKSI